MGVITNLLNNSNKLSTGITVNIPQGTEKYQVSSLDIFKAFLKEKDTKVIRLIEEDSFQHIHFTSYYMMRKFNKDYKDFIKKIIKTNKDITFSLDTNDDL